MRQANQENDMITISNAKTLTALINTASATNTTRFAAQRGIFFDSMADMICLAAA